MSVRDLVNKLATVARAFARFRAEIAERRQFLVPALLLVAVLEGGATSWI